jgi:hypothetical protein
VPALAPLSVASDGSAARWRTIVRACHDGRTLHVRYDCEDDDVWSTYTRRDEPLWEEEVVELFLAAGSDDPLEYVELEVNPHGALFDARVRNPHSRRDTMAVDPSWDAPGIVWSAGRRDGGWWAYIGAPWLALTGAAAPPAACRANFFRVERPRRAPSELSAWSPPLTSPPDFHVPARFGFLLIG